MITRTVEWLNANSYRHYPFVDDADLTFTGGLTLPLDVFLDFGAVDYTWNGAAFTLVSVRLTTDVPPNLSFEFEYAGTAHTVDIPVTAELPATSATVNGLDWGLSTTIVFGTGVQTLAASLTPGLVYSAMTPVPFQPALIVKQIRTRVDSVKAKAVGQAVLDGRISVMEGYNCRVTVLNNPAKMRIDAGYGYGAGVPCDTPTGLASCAQVLLRINGLNAGEGGNFGLFAGPGVEVTPDAHGLTIKGKKTRDNIACSAGG